jgi:hypothetical protein
LRWRNGLSQQREPGFDPIRQARVDSALSVFQKRDPRLKIKLEKIDAQLGEWK